MVDYSYEHMMRKFDQDEWNAIFNTIKFSMESLCPITDQTPVGMRDALIFNEAAQILGQTSILYRFHKEYQYNEEE